MLENMQTIDRGAITTGGLRFTDLKRAHTSAKLINTKRVGYEQHGTLEDLEAHRERMSFDMTPEDVERAARLERIEHDEEQRRRGNVQTRDQMIADQHHRLEQLMLQ